MLCKREFLKYLSIPKIDIHRSVYAPEFHYYDIFGSCYRFSSADEMMAHLGISNVRFSHGFYHVPSTTGKQTSEKEEVKYEWSDEKTSDPQEQSSDSTTASAQESAAGVAEEQDEPGSGSESVADDGVDREWIASLKSVKEDKKKLATYAKTFGIKLDPKYSLANMVAKFEAQLTAQINP